MPGRGSSRVPGRAAECRALRFRSQHPHSAPAPLSFSPWLSPLLVLPLDPPVANVDRPSRRAWDSRFLQNHIAEMAVPASSSMELPVRRWLPDLAIGLS